MQQNELTHYGVLGMRWGVHRAKRAAAFGNRGKALKRTQRLLRRYDRRMNKNLLKVKMNKQSAYFESNNYQAKKYVAAKKNAEAAAFVYEKMQSVFSDAVLSTLATRQGVSFGEKYVQWRLYADED